MSIRLQSLSSFLVVRGVTRYASQSILSMAFGILIVILIVIIIVIVIFTAHSFCCKKFDLCEKWNVLILCKFLITTAIYRFWYCRPGCAWSMVLRGCIVVTVGVAWNSFVKRKTRREHFCTYRTSMRYLSNGQNLFHTIQPYRIYNLTCDASACPHHHASPLIT